MKTACKVDGCKKFTARRGWCGMHFMRLERHGDTSWEPMPDEVRFWLKVNKTVECWLWLGSLGHNGYGRFWFNRKTVKAHRYSYELAKGKIPKGLTIDHLCKTRSCVNPSHLEAVTIGVNVKRGENFIAKNAAKTHCLRGHPFSGYNVRVDIKGHRTCRTCAREAVRLARLKRIGKLYYA